MEIVLRVLINDISAECSAALHTRAATWVSGPNCIHTVSCPVTGLKGCNGAEKVPLKRGRNGGP